MRVTVRDSALAPSMNEWGIADLDPAIQPTAVVAPLVAWGSVARTRQHGGTWHFYVDDTRFTSPNLAEQAAKSIPAACVEPNYSVFEWTTRAEALWTIYKKRRTAWQMQRLGIPVFVDLCVPHAFHDLMLIGVPKGWKAYATRGFEARPGEVEDEYALAAEHAGGRPIFLVIGGGKKVRDVVSRLPGAIHCPDHMQAQRESMRCQREAGVGVGVGPRVRVAGLEEPRVLEAAEEAPPQRQLVLLKPSAG